MDPEETVINHIDLNNHFPPGEKTVARLIPLLLCGLFFCALSLHAQQSAPVLQENFAALVGNSYGQDQELVNGMQYYNKHSRSLGNPYLLGDFVQLGSVTIRSVIYKDVWLRYNIHAQHVEVAYQTMNGADNQVILVGDRVDRFNMGNQEFRRISLLGKAEQYYQVLGSDRLFCYISWEKKLVPVSGNSLFIEEFTAAKRSYLLELDGVISPFQNKKGFVKLFPENRQKEVKRLIRTNHVQLRSASPEQIDQLLLSVVNLLKVEVR